jgi:hypothetical protein
MDKRRLEATDLTPRQATRSVPGLGVVQFRTLSIGISFDLYERYFRQPARVDYRAFVSTLIAEMVISPQLKPDAASQLSERARGSLRLGIADAAGVLPEYRRLTGTMLSADERLFAVLFNAHRCLTERAVAKAKEIGEAVSTNLTNVLGPSLPRVNGLAKQLSGFHGAYPTASLRRTQESIRIAKVLGSGGPPNAAAKHLVDLTARTGQVQPLRNLMRSPAVDIARKAQGDFGVRSPVLDAISQSQAALADAIAAPMAEMVAQAQKTIASVVRPLVLDVARRNEKAIKQALRSPTAEMLEQTRARLAELASPTIESVLEQGRRLAIQAGRGFVRGVEGAARFFDENWAQFQGNPRYPKPVLFVIASLPGALGLPLYHSIKERHDEQLIGLLEPVLTNPDLVDETKSAVAAAPLLHAVAKRQMFKAFDSIRDGEYSEACPQLYAALEAGFYAAAEAANVIDARSKFRSQVDASKSKARKVDDLFEHLLLNPRYERFLRSWIFGDEGARFRHGRVSEPEECRRQALLLAMAVLGWLELFGEWNRDGFRRLLHDEALGRARLAAPATVRAA